MTTTPWWSSQEQQQVSLPAPRPPRAPQQTTIPGLADWNTRACATAIEVGLAGGIMTAYGYLLVFAKSAFAIIQVAGMLVGIDIRGTLAALYWILGLGFLVWQWSVRGITGQSLGQKLMGIVTVDEGTGRPIGPARSILRSLLHCLDILPAFAGYARPVFHFHRQTWADTASRTVVVKMSLINSIAASE